MKLILLAKRCDITLKICTEGKYDMYKERVNDGRRMNRVAAEVEMEAQIAELCKADASSTDKEKVEEVKKQMKKTVSACQLQHRLSSRTNQTARRLDVIMASLQKLLGGNLRRMFLAMLRPI